MANCSMSHTISMLDIKVSFRGHTKTMTNELNTSMKKLFGISTNRLKRSSGCEVSRNVLGRG